MTSWTNRFLELADHFASWSKDPSTRVGCVIVDDERRVMATGFNGFPRGVADTEERLNNRPTKHLFVVHAEANAIAMAARSGVPLLGCTAYVTHPPCAQCAALMVQAGIKTVISKGELRPDWAASTEASQTILGEGGVDWVMMVPEGGE